MTVAPWEALTTLGRAIRAADWFDEQERDYKLAIAPKLQSALEVAHDGEWWAPLDAVFKSKSYNLTNFRQHRWLREWAAADSGLSEVVAGFLDLDLSPVERFAQFAQAAEAAEVVKGHGAAVLAFGSLFNMAAQPDSLPLVRAQVFEAVEKHVGWNTASSATPTERYQHHLRFAEEVRARLEAAGAPIRDMIDVQGVVWVLSHPTGPQLQRLANEGRAKEVEVWAAGQGNGQQTLEGVVSREAVLAAIQEFDNLGRDAFLAKYHFGGALKYVLLEDGKTYDSKAIYGVAYGFEHPDDGPLKTTDFTGGEHSVVRKLRRLGFDVRERGEIAEASSALHLLLRWSVDRGPRTIDAHKEVAEQHGAVWWGKLDDPNGNAAIAATRLQALEHQLAEEIPTFVYLHRTGETWRTHLRDISLERPEHETQLIPEYYRDADGEHHLWVKLEEFEQISADYPEQDLLLDGSDDPASIAKAFKGQATLLYVRERPPRPDTKVWWVNQGSSFARSREGGYLWAPKRNKLGKALAHWESLREAAPGDVVLNYARGSIRCVSRVAEAAVDAGRPSEPHDGAWEDDGRLVRLEYRDLAMPLPLNAIPEDWRLAEGAPFDELGGVRQGYFFALSPEFVGKLASRFPQLSLETSNEVPSPGYKAPSFDEIIDRISAQGISLAGRTVRRYHLSLAARGFVVLSGVSGTGKTWLAEAYAEAIGAEHLLVPVAPNWTTNEDLLGYLNPLSGQYHDTPFSRFLRNAAVEYERAERHGESARPFHLTLDEMNLARVEYYFAKFLSGMEVRARNGTAAIELAPEHEVLLTPNLFFTGTVNVDETTHGFADKVYDRAQLIELEVSREMLRDHLDGQPYQAALMAVWDAVVVVAPFAFRVLDEVAAYVHGAAELGVPWKDALDEQLLQKVLPKIKGVDLRVEVALKTLVAETDEYPLCQTKAKAMLEAFEQHGFTSYF